MPETMRVMAFIKAPLGRGRGGRLGALPGVLPPFERRGTALYLGDILEFPGQAFRPKLRLRLDEAAGFLLHLPCEEPGRPTGGGPFGQAGQRVAVPEALNGARRGRRWASLSLDLRRTPGRMTLGQLHERLFLRGREPIGWTLWSWAVVRQGTLEGCECTVAPFIEDATAHPKAGRHVGDRLTTTEGEDRLEPMFPWGAGRLRGGLHGGVLLLSRVDASW